MHLKFLFAAYGAAGVSFLATLIRDYAVINHTHQSKEFFQLLYVVSLAAGFGVNAITAGSGLLGRVALTLLSLLGVTVIVVMLPDSNTTPHTIILLVLILLLWIVGAHWSRSLLERGWVFFARVREAIASLALAVLVLVGIAVEPAFLMAAACGAAFSWLMWKASPSSMDSPPSGNTLRELRKLFISVVLTNVATFSILSWALIQTGSHGEVFGYEISTAVRFAMYLYQVLTIGAVVLVSLKGKLISEIKLGPIILVASLLFVASLFFPLELALFLLPLAAAVVHYGLVLLLQLGKI